MIARLYQDELNHIFYKYCTYQLLIFVYYLILRFYGMEVLKQQLLAQFPELKGMTFRMALDRKLLQVDTDISQGQEIALLPPFSGG